MLIESILDATDPRIAVFRNLKDMDLRRRNSFIVEGKFILETLLTRSRYQITSILIAEDRIVPLATLLSAVPEGIPIFSAKPDVLADIAGFDVHRGILAAGAVPDTLFNLPANLTEAKRVAILSNISNPDNIGAIFRNAAGLGIDAIWLDQQCCSPLYRKAIRVSMGATLVLPWVQSGQIHDILGQLTVAGFSIYALSLQSGKLLEDFQFENQSAFLFGEEAHGLPPHFQKLCHAITIPMENGTDSLNVAATSAIVFETARRQQK